MRLTVFLVSLLVVSWGASAAAQDEDAQPEPTPAPDSDAAAPDDASESAPAESDEVPEETTPSEEESGESPVVSEDQSEPEAQVDAEVKSEQEAADQQPPQPPPSITPQVITPAPSAMLRFRVQTKRKEARGTVPRSVRTEERKWTASQPVLTLHGYMRMRGELQDTFWLGVYPRPIPLNPSNPFHASSLRTTAKPTNCGDDCDVDSLQFANMRLRLAPQLNISDDVRVKMMFDMFDNMVAGSTPVTYYGAHEPEPATLFPPPIYRRSIAILGRYRR